MDCVKTSPPGALRSRRSRPVLKNRLKSARMRAVFPSPATTSSITGLRMASAPNTRDAARNMMPKTARATIPGAESNFGRLGVCVPSLGLWNPTAPGGHECGYTLLACDRTTISSVYVAAGVVTRSRLVVEARSLPRGRCPSSAAIPPRRIRPSARRSRRPQDVRYPSPSLPPFCL
jgi:hypothetical protein